MRYDLRMHDNSVLHWAVCQQERFIKAKVDFEFVPIFCFDPRFYDNNCYKYATKMCGAKRTIFDIESVVALRTNLMAIESNLKVKVQW